MSFSTDMDNAIADMATARKAAVKSAFTTLQSAIQEEQVAYESPAAEKIAFNETLLSFARDLARRMH